MWPIKNFEKYFMAHQYMPKILHHPHKNPLAPPPTYLFSLINEHIYFFFLLHAFCHIRIYFWENYFLVLTWQQQLALNFVIYKEQFCLKLTVKGLYLLFASLNCSDYLVHAFLYKQHFYKQPQAENGEKSSKN